MPVARLKLTKALRSQPTKRKPVWDSEIGKVLRPVWKPPSLELPIELLVSAVSLNDLDLDACCQWPISGEGRATPFCGANRNDSDHPSYCQHHAARSIKVETVMPSRDMLGTLRNDSQSPNQTQPA
jgi:hypothetical protein